MFIMFLKCIRKRCRYILFLIRYKRELYRSIWFVFDFSVIDSRLRFMWIIIFVLWRFKGLVSEIRNRNNLRIYGKLYGNNGLEFISYYYKKLDINIFFNKDLFYIFEIVFYRLRKILFLLKKNWNIIYNE